MQRAGPASDGGLAEAARPMSLARIRTALHFI
jgi:hypothetical protein